MNPPIKDWVQEVWPILYRSSGTRSHHDMYTIFGYRKPKSLQDILVYTDISITQKKKKLTQNAIEKSVEIVFESFDQDRSQMCKECKVQ